MMILGTLTDEGVNCRAVRGDDGELYTFRHLPEELETGDRIAVEITQDPLAFACDQGRAVGWSSVKRLGDPEKVWTSE